MKELRNGRLSHPPRPFPIFLLAHFIPTTTMNLYYYNIMTLKSRRMSAYQLIKTLTTTQIPMSATVSSSSSSYNHNSPPPFNSGKL